MAKDEPNPKPKPGRINAPSTKVTIAFPFSAIKMEEASDELLELAAVVAELAEEVAKLRPSERNDELVQRTRAVITKLQS